MFSSSMTFHVQSIYILRFNVDIGSLVLFCTYESYECKKNLLTRYIYIFYVSILIFYAQDVIPADFKQLFAYITSFYNVIQVRSFDHIIKTRISRNE